MKILIFEDNDYKASRTIRALKKVIPRCDIDVSDNIIEGINKAKEVKYDIYVVDMMIPMRSDSNIERFGGHHILNKLHRYELLSKRAYFVNTSAKEHAIAGLKDSMFENTDILHNDGVSSIIGKIKDILIKQGVELC